MNVDEGPPDETVELTEDRWILLVFSRRWPRYVVTWSIRQRSGDSDYPVRLGEVEAPPSRDGGERVWTDLRQKAIDEAMAADGTTGELQPSRSLLSRLLGRR